MKTIQEAEHFISDKLEAVKQLFLLVKMEGRLAGLSIYPLLLTLCALFIVFITFWLSAMLLVGYLIGVAISNYLIAGFCVFLLNLILTVLLLKYLLFNIKNMSFQKTRHYFQQEKSMNNGPIQKKTDC